MEKKKPKILLSAAGTGGHLIPALHVAARLTAKSEVFFVASGLEKNPFFNRKYRHYSISSGFLSKNPMALIKTFLKLSQGVYESLQILRKEKPDLVVGFGSFVTFPVLTAAWLLRIKIILHEQNQHMGIVNRLFAPVAHSIASYFPLPHNHGFQVAGPIIVKPKINHQKLTVLIMGGSQGASFLNKIVLDCLSHLKNFKIIHLVGLYDPIQPIEKAYEQIGIEACIKTFTSEMEDILPTIDCAVTRAGAGTLMELIGFEIPAFLIPFPKAKKDHQKENAAFFINEVKGGVMQIEKEVSQTSFLENLNQVIEKREIFSHNIRQYKKKMNPKDFSSYLMELVNGS